MLRLLTGAALILKWFFDPEVKAKGTEPDLQIMS